VPVSRGRRRIEDDLEPVLASETHRTRYTLHGHLELHEQYPRLRDRMGGDVDRVGRHELVRAERCGRLLASFVVDLD
jgi:hypothetical protein